jgi:hypothetical protein
VKNEADLMQWLPSIAIFGGLEEPTLKRIIALLGEHHIDDEAQQRRGIGSIIGREVKSRGDLTEGEAQKVIKDLAARPKPSPEPEDDYVAAVAAQDEEAAQ